MARESSAVVVSKMMRLIHLVNDLSDPDTETDNPVTLDECARMLALKPGEVERLIDKINLGCGDALPELFIDYDEETQMLTPHPIGIALEKPLRLSAGEARGLLTALEAAGIGRSDPLAAKIEGAFPAIDPSKLAAIQNAARVGNLGTVLQNLTAAIEHRHPVRITYKGLADTRASGRTVEPRDIIFEAREHAWYLSAWCRRAGDWRTFRLDRIEHIEALEDETFEPQPAGDAAPQGLDAVDDAPMAVLAVHNPRSMADQAFWRGMLRLDCPLPHDARRLTAEERANGAFIAAIPWAQGSPWLARAIAQAFGGIEVIRPLELRAAVAETARKFQELLREGDGMHAGVDAAQ